MTERNLTTDAKFIDAWKTSTSISQVLISLGLAPKGGNYKTARRRASKLGLSDEDFATQECQQTRSKEQPKLLVLKPREGEKGVTSSNILMERLIKLGIFPRACCRCDITHYHDVPAPLELEHIDGNHFNNNLENLTILCINCHSQTETYVGKNNRQQGNLTK